MGKGVRMSLDQLPPHLREQAERKLGLSASQQILPIQQSNLPVNKPHEATLIKAPPPDTATKTVRKQRKTLTPDQADSIVKAVKVSEDGNEVKFVLSVDPHTCSTAQQKGAMAFIGKDGKAHTRFYTKAKIAKAEKTFTLAFQPYANLTRKWGRVPYEVEFLYYFGYPSGTPKKDIHKIGPMLERPDASNITKGIADALTEAGMWEDDSLIANEISRKRRTTQTPCIVIKIRNLQPKFEALYRDTEEHDSPTLFNQDKPSPMPSETNPLAALQAGQSDDQTPLKEN